MNRRRTLSTLLAATVLVGVAACSSGSKSSAPSTSSAPTPSSSGSTPAGSGSTNGSAAPISIGLVTSKTGLAAPNFNGAQQGVAARFAVQNAQGGVNGHQL